MHLLLSKMNQICFLFSAHYTTDDVRATLFSPQCSYFKTELTFQMWNEKFNFLQTTLWRTVINTFILILMSISLTQQGNVCWVMGRTHHLCLSVTRSVFLSRCSELHQTGWSDDDFPKFSWAHVASHQGTNIAPNVACVVDVICKTWLIGAVVWVVYCVMRLSNTSAMTSTSVHNTQD